MLLKRLLPFLALFGMIQCAGELRAQSHCDTFYTDFATHQIRQPWDQSPDQYLSIIGRYKDALREEDTAGAGRRFKDYFPFADRPGDHLLCTEIEPTLQASITQTHRVIINEAHNNPRSRVNLYQLVDFFKENGYHDIFMETLAWNDTLREKYGIVNHNSGYYTLEVMYADLIRKLLASNMRMHAYEVGDHKIDTATVNGKLMFVSKDYPKWIQIASDSFLLDGFLSEYRSRDVRQALFIYQKILQNKIARYIIYCGHGHGRVGTSANMGNTLRHLTGERATVIDQTFMHERSPQEYDYDIYTKYAHVDHPMIISRADKSPLLQFENNSKIIEKTPSYDYYILSPRTIYKNNRPDWQSLNGAKHSYSLSSFVNKKNLPSGYLVLAYYQDEYDKAGNCAVPADVFEVTDNSQNYDLILFPNRKYYLKITKGDNTLVDKLITVEN